MCQRTRLLTKILPVLLLILMALHLAKPLGLPGLRRRSDFWKIAVLAIGLMFFVVALHAGAVL
ncbi:hypothetical protein M1D80_22675 [Phyllobacteriaceae bacterium JZ32]